LKVEFRLRILRKGRDRNDRAHIFSVVAAEYAMRMLRLLLATEHALYRAGLRCLLERVDGVKVVADTGSGREAVSLSKNHRPAVVLIETDLAEVGGLEAIGQILSSSPDSRVILVMADGDAKVESRAIESGAAGVLSRSASVRDLERVLRTVREGRPVGAVALADGARVRRQKPSRASQGHFPLTPRQLEVLKLLSEGSGVKKIARLLGISAKTVETHRSQVMERLHIYDLVGLVRYALRERITRL
jgi:DNA-binding NarL/FixJ family response regulator